MRTLRIPDPRDDDEPYPRLIMDIGQLKLEVYRICACLTRVPPSKRLAVLRRQINRLPPDCREIALCLVTTTMAHSCNSKSMQTWEKVTMITAGAVLALVLLGVAIWIPAPSPTQIFVVRVILALAGAAFVCVLPGLLEVQGRARSLAVRAGGSLGVFVLIYLLNPPKLISSAPPPDPDRAAIHLPR